MLNAKDYGMPQNRERVFIISIRKDVDNGKFEFPKPFDNGIRLKDMLEDKVEEKYYISQEKTEKLIKEIEINKSNEKQLVMAVLTPDRINKRQNGRRFKENNEPMFTLTSQDRHGILQVGKLDISRYDMTNRVYSPEGISPTINTMQGGNLQPKILVKYKIRKLTPLECWRLMGFDDEDYWKARKALEETFYKGKDKSNSQMYKMAGNSIVVNVLEEIFRNLFTK